MRNIHVFDHKRYRGFRGFKRVSGAQPARSHQYGLRWLWLILVVTLVVIYLLVNLHFPQVQPAGVNVYLAQPLSWMCAGLIAYWGWRFTLPVRPRIKRTLVGLAILIGLFQIAFMLIAGMLAGFGHSPYGHRPLVLLGNLVFMSSLLISVEICRAYLVAVLSLGNRTLAILICALLFTMISIPFARYITLEGGASLFSFFGGRFLPLLAENVLSSVLAFLGGPLLALAYRGTLAAFEWLSPVLPDLPWILSAFVGTMAPALGLMLVQENTAASAGVAAATLDPRERSTKSWLLVGSVAVLLLWFNTGFLGVRPTVVSGVSMEPALMAGDLVITREVSPETIQLGDIIRFREEGTFILHRVVAIEEGKHGIEFITKGDANNVIDPPIQPSEIEGKVILKIPKIGWVTIGIRSLLAWNR